MILEIYADIVFGVNFIMNTVIFYLAKILCQRKTGIRLVLGSAFSALFYTVMLFTSLLPFINIFTSFVILAPGIYIAFFPKNLKSFVSILMAAYICSFALGGISLAISHIINDSHILSSQSMALNNFTAQNLFMATIISFAMLKYAQINIFKKTMNRQSYCQFNIYLKDNVVSLQALVDTGNSLVDPISKNPVIVAEFAKIKGLLPVNIVDLYTQNKQDDLTALAKSFDTDDFKKRIRMIPFSAVGSKHGVLIGFRPDKIELEKTEKGTNKEIKDVIIAICDFSLSKDGEYYALINPILI